ncbi:MULTISPECIES: hypothetical protein [Salipiger]|jgi:hypothetical protein|uniref:Transglutaminase-like cysteine proteinase BTLCP n=1 Tax=Salipiger profundus TaxID=1229727 RepID=A0A1U7D872_9RHOB|nr:MULTISPECIES: hypothetical protein [Salipiger]APX24323.1 hypothetical protein Ga0080559_TMP3527 [Salipiger profundus]GFZ95982.1 hypothetical protein GCM10011326_03930 [Salipiger profundus]SFB83905.1 hypothetical protein SAMN05444415_101151 [Salipiger profundus]
MKRRKVARIAGALLCAALLSGCAGSPTSTETPPAAPTATEVEAQVAEVTQALRALGPGVDPAEAARAAEIAVREPLDWARDWQVVDPPLVHNFKVVHGLREKGVCQDWADALEIALHAEGFRTLELHRALANARNMKLEHATVIITARGQPMQQGLILDPWRIGQGRLFFSRVADDPRYDWESREAVRAWNREWKARALAQL